MRLQVLRRTFGADKRVLGGGSSDDVADCHTMWVNVSREYLEVFLSLLPVQRIVSSDPEPGRSNWSKKKEA